jgi:hypothetical protein
MCSAGPSLDTKPVAPACNASIAVATSEYAVRTTITGGAGSARSRAVSSMPLSRPSCTSMITTSGLRDRTAPAT